MRVLLQLMLSANAWVVTQKAELHRIPVCDMYQALRSDSGVLAKLANHRYSDSGNDLAVGVMKFEPSVVCSPQRFQRDARVLGACETIVDKLKASKDLEIFSNRGFQSGDSDIVLPLSYTAPGEGSADHLYSFTKLNKLTKNAKEPMCILRLTGTRPRNSGSWYVIWETAVAITAMCIRQGKGGSWEGLGKSGKFSSDFSGVCVVNVLLSGATQSLTVSMGKAEQPPSVEAE